MIEIDPSTPRARLREEVEQALRRRLMKQRIENTLKTGLAAFLLVTFGAVLAKLLILVWKWILF